MAEKEVKLMKGNEAIAHALIRCGADAFFGYPITPADRDYRDPLLPEALGDLRHGSSPG